MIKKLIEVFKKINNILTTENLKFGLAYFIHEIVHYILLLFAFYPGFRGYYIVLSGGNLNLNHDEFLGFITFLEMIVMFFLGLMILFVLIAEIFEWAKNVRKQ